MDGIFDGSSDRVEVGTIVGLTDADGLPLAIFEGLAEGAMDGNIDIVGWSLSMADGETDGKFVGLPDGAIDGLLEGKPLGFVVGVALGFEVGLFDGTMDTEGPLLARADGVLEGADDGAGDTVGLSLAIADGFTEATLEGL